MGAYMNIPILSSCFSLTFQYMEDLKNIFYFNTYLIIFNTRYIQSVLRYSKCEIIEDGKQENWNQIIRKKNQIKGTIVSETVPFI